MKLNHLMNNVWCIFMNLGVRNRTIAVGQVAIGHSLDQTN